MPRAKQERVFYLLTLGLLAALTGLFSVQLKVSLYRSSAEQQTVNSTKMCATERPAIAQRPYHRTLPWSRTPRLQIVSMLSPDVPHAWVAHRLYTDQKSLFTQLRQLHYSYLFHKPPPFLF
jgi:hypothetical protein